MVILFGSLSLDAQRTFNFDGQLSGVANYSPDNTIRGLLNGRYLPELNYDWKPDSAYSWYFEASANMYGSAYFYTSDSASIEGDVRAYRIWTRFSGKQYEVRLGLQKIDFGSAMVLRPLQWFNEIDPRDPLAITDGVNAVLVKYYFLNNANVWFWALYGNQDPRGFDLAGSHKNAPEFGGRFQYPIPKGELALSYHHRTADATEITDNPGFEQVPENRIGLDGKWDLGVGLWFEGAYIKKQKNIGLFTHQVLATLGMDYTFGVGSGLNVVAEHLMIGYDQTGIGFAANYNTTALNISYPIGFFDNLNMFTTYSWEAETASFFLNYQHDFRRVTGFFMVYYTPTTTLDLGNEGSDFVNSFTGPGLRVMLVFNH
ncbi:hypothetical protein FNH22_24660 [Fulvivirga sp. M361]|nr:hypothetical protein FNH22_24660 [Fulvivirga sp. M361]